MNSVDNNSSRFYSTGGSSLEIITWLKSHGSNSCGTFFKFNLPKKWISRLEIHRSSTVGVENIFHEKCRQNQWNNDDLGSSYCNVECTGIHGGLNRVDLGIKRLVYIESMINCSAIDVRIFEVFLERCCTLVEKWRVQTYSKLYFLYVKFVV